jgi:superfamily II DNA or RNA helicase
MIKIIIGNIYSKVVGVLSDPVVQDLDKVLSYKIQNARFMPAFKSGSWDGTVKLFLRYKGNMFYSGLMSLVRETLKKHNVEFELVDRRIKPEQNLPDLKFLPPLDYESRKYQDITVERSLKYTRGVLSMATGSGKTLVAVRLISNLRTSPVIFYTLTKDLMEQSHGVLSSCLNQPIGRIGDGECDIKKINVCTIQTAIRALNYKNTSFKVDDYRFDDEDEWDEKGIENEEKADRIRTLIKTAKVVIADEAHHVAARTVKEVLTASTEGYYRYGLSATPIREDNASILIQGMFGAKIVDINASYLIRAGDLVKPYIFIEPVDSKANLHSYQKIYAHCIVNNESFNKHVAATVNHLVKRGLSVLVLVQQYKHGDYLKTLIPNSEFITSRVSTEKRLQYINDLRAGKITLLSSSILDEGADIRGLDAVVLCGGGKSQGRVYQRIGRSLRRDKKSTKQKDKSIIVVYEHNAKYLDKHAKRIRSILKKEPEFTVIDSKGPNFILKEIDDILGVKNESKDLFNE